MASEKPSLLHEPVTVTLQELNEGTVPLSKLEEAFGPSSLGIIVVKGLDERFVELRRRVLSYSSYLANLPADELAKLENPSAKFLTGWSLGRETLKSGRVDTYKGSYYINCAPRPNGNASSNTTNGTHIPNDLASLYPNLPEYTAPNIFPAASVLPGFEAATSELCGLVIDVAIQVAKACDRFAEAHVEGYAAGGFLERVVRESRSTKARLLHYFPRSTAASSASEQDDDEDEDDWCATHVDHGCLTGLTSAMYVDETAHPPQQAHTAHTPSSGRGGGGGAEDTLPLLPELPASPDAQAGLHIHTRTGSTVQVRIPRDSLAFQTGEALERMTRGKFKAVPHYVKGISKDAAREKQAGGVARNTLAVFTQPNLWEVVDWDRGKDFAAFAREIVERNTAY